MGSLISGYDKHVEEARAGQAAEFKLSRLPWSPAFASLEIHLIQTSEDASAFAAQIRKSNVSMLGVDTEFTYDRPPIALRAGQEFIDPSTIRPQVCSIVAWCGATQTVGDRRQDILIRGVFDLRCPEVFPALSELFTLGLQWVAHSASAELHCLWACGIRPPEHLLIDTYVIAACLNNGRFRRHKARGSITDDIAQNREQDEKLAHITSLVGQCEHYGIPHPFATNKHEMRERFMQLGPEDPLDSSMLKYAASDAEFALRLYFRQQQDIDRLGLSLHLNRDEFPVVSTLARMEFCGLPFDQNRAKDYADLCRKIVDTYATRLKEFGIQPDSRNSFLNTMNRAGLSKHFLTFDKKYSTCLEVLVRCEESGIHPAVRLFRLHRHFQRLATELSVLMNLVSTDGRLRYSLRQLGSASGRISSVRPNLIGLDGRLRPIIATTASNVLIELDYSQIEVGLAGAVWNDSALIELFNTDDAYAAIAQSFFRDQLTPEERVMTPSQFKKARPDLRKSCKALMLGALYGLGEETLSRKLKCSTEQAAEELKRFFRHFPGTAGGAKRAVDAALANGYGITATGFRRFIEVGDRRVARAMRNHPVQGVAAAIFKAAISRVDRQFRGTKTRLLLPRHDSILIETPVETRDEVVASCKLLMIHSVREIYPNLSPRVEYKVGPSWPTEKTLEAYYHEEVNVRSPSDVPHQATKNES